MERYENIYEELRSKGLRVTKQRKEIINILEGRHLTFQEIKAELQKRGFQNLATLYNNIDFLLEHNLIIELHINGVRYFDLSIDELSHDANSHVHVMCKRSDLIVEVNDETIMELIKSHPTFKEFEADKVQLVINGKCRNENKETCDSKETLCFLRKLGTPKKNEA